jgi:Protein-tyrosine-phosphatase
MKILFVCKSNVARSQIAKALYNLYTNTNNADGAGTDVGHPEYDTIRKWGEGMYPEGETSRSHRVLLEKYNIDISDSPRVQIIPEMLKSYDLVVNLAERFQTPDWLRGDNVIWWDLKDPGLTEGMDAFYTTLTYLEKRVRELVEVLSSNGDAKDLDDHIDNVEENS